MERKFRKTTFILDIYTEDHRSKESDNTLKDLDGVSLKRTIGENHHGIMFHSETQLNPKEFAEQIINVKNFNKDDLEHFNLTKEGYDIDCPECSRTHREYELPPNIVLGCHKCKTALEIIGPIDITGKQKKIEERKKSIEQHEKEIADVDKEIEMLMENKDPNDIETLNFYAKKKTSLLKGINTLNINIEKTEKEIESANV